MIRIFLFSLFSGLLFLGASAQQLNQYWLQTFQAQGKAADRVAAITTDASGNVYVTGFAGNHHGSPDAFAMKRNPQGDTLWTYYYDGGGHNEDYAADIFVDNNGNTYITGRSQGTPSIYECFTVKLFPSGAEDWVARYSPGGNMQSYGNAIALDASGNVYVAGYSDPLSGSSDWLVIKYNAAGIQQWADVLNGPGNGDDEASDIVMAPNGNPTVCGFTYSVNASGGINAFVKQYTPANGTAWSDTWSHPAFTGTDKAMGLGFNNSGDLLVGGTTMNNSSSNNDALALRYDSAGNMLWSAIYSDSTTASDEYLLNVQVDDSGNVYFAGTDYLNGYVTRINHNGTNGWRKKWNGPVNGWDVFYAIAVDDNENVYATGRGVYPGEDYYGNGGLPNMIITRYNAAGDSVWTYRCQDSLNSSMGFAITCSNGKVYAGGFVTDTAYVNENLYTIITDTSGNPVSEWKYNGRGDAITMGQFVVTDAAGSVYCAATIDRLYSGGNDVAIVKYDHAGLLVWEKYYSSYGWNNDTLTAMQLDPSGNLVLCISTDSAMLENNYMLTLLKIDPDGNFLDTAAYNPSPAGSTLARSMVIRNDGSIALAAASNIHGGMILFFDAAWNAAWSAKIDSMQFAVTDAKSIGLFPNGDMVVGGYSDSGLVRTAVVQRYDANGTKLWSAILDSAGVYDVVNDVTVDAAGDVAFTGYSGSFSGYATMVGKISGAAGGLIWKDMYNPNTTREHGVKVRFTPAGNIALISRGWTGFVARYYTLQYSGTGTFLWAGIYSPTASDREPVDLIVTPNNDVVTAGWAINGFTTNYDYVLAGYDATGATAFTNTYTDTNLVSASWDQLYDLTMDSQGNFIVTGISGWEFYNEYLYKMVTIKYGTGFTGTADHISQNRQTYAYPNPSTGIFTLVDAGPGHIISGIVYDLQGRLVTVMDISKMQADLSHCQPGLYILELKCDGLPDKHLRLLVHSWY